MRKNIFLLVVLLGIFLVNGCATPGPVKNTLASNAFYTDASQQVAFDACAEAMQKLGYNIEVKDKDNFFIKGSYYPMVSGAYVRTQIDVTKEASGTKIVCSADWPSVFKCDAFGYYTRYIDNIYNELSQNLGGKGYKIQKSK